PDALDQNDLNLRGRFNLENALVALEAARLLQDVEAATVDDHQATRADAGREHALDVVGALDVTLDWSDSPQARGYTLRTRGQLARARAGARGRRRPERWHGLRAGPGAGRPDDPVRRPRGRSRDAQAAWSGGVIALGLGEVAALCDGALQAAAGATHVAGVKVDSRLVEPGDLFVAVGAGSAFLADARDHGAAATLVPADAFAALAALGAAVRDRSEAQV